MSIESELERLNTAKTDIAAAIQQKGVIVPELARLSDYPDFVESIPVHFSNAGCTASMRTDLTVPGATGNPQLVLDTMDCSFGGCALQNGGIKIPENGYYLISASVLIKSGVLTEKAVCRCPAKKSDEIGYYYIGGLIPGDSKFGGADFPVAFDKPGNHKNHVNILFMTGAVESIKIPNYQKPEDVIKIVGEKFKLSQEDIAFLLERCREM